MILNSTINKYLFLGILILNLSCGVLQKSRKNKKTDHYVLLDTLNIPSIVAPKVYHEAKKKTWDLLHTKLDLSFDWEKQHVLGKANLKLKPYFYPSDRIELDAKGFEIKKIEKVVGGSNRPIEFIYDDLKIFLKLDQKHERLDTLEILIEYIAKPNDLKPGGSAAITSDIGLYFINPTNSEPDKPQQIWTQGETESNSCWFPTIDAPNEKMTQEIYLTVDKKYLTISNGYLEYSTENNDGTRTDYWKQDLPHAPYLTMVCVGEFTVIKDRWEKDSATVIDVNYYVESEYENSAVSIFGNTPQMIEFYSEILDYDFPWDKYDQVIVRDFVSGAMENTSAVIHGEFLQNTERELLDEDYEFIIAHELFHHWFGDLVTCESWANLPLNESFATYGEYLWKEYKYGRDDADAHLVHNRTQYLQESNQKQVDMIRYYYDDREDMFDSHSYAKGGCILHMLRKYVGDQAFFKSLNLYLKTNEFKTVEIHDLRKAFEIITGEDLNWFFDQWFLSSGHPSLHIQYSYDIEQGFAYVLIEQKQDIKSTPIYRLPMKVDVYESNEKIRYDIVLDSISQTFSFPIKEVPDLINVDSERSILCKKSDLKTKGNYKFQFHNAPLYEDKYESLLALAQLPRDSGFNGLLLKALNDPFYLIKELAIGIYEGGDDVLDNKLQSLAENDEKSSVRASALSTYSQHVNDDSKINFLKSLLDDPSYLVISEALHAINESDSITGSELAQSFEGIANDNIQIIVSNIYTQRNKSDKVDYFIKLFQVYSSYDLIVFISNFQRYLIQTEIEESAIERSLTHFREIVQKDEVSVVKAYAIVSLKKLSQHWEDKYPTLGLKIETMLEEMKSKETDEGLMKYY